MTPEQIETLAKSAYDIFWTSTRPSYIPKFEFKHTSKLYQEAWRRVVTGLYEEMAPMIIDEIERTIKL